MATPGYTMAHQKHEVLQMATYRVNYGFKGVNNKLRSGSLVLNAKDAKEAVKAANAQLSKEHDWYQITGTRELDTTTSII